MTMFLSHGCDTQWRSQGAVVDAEKGGGANLDFLDQGKV